MDERNKKLIRFALEADSASVLKFCVDNPFCTKNRLVKQALARAKAEQMQNLEQKRLAVEKEIKADEDFAAYSRKNERDFALCKKSGSEECRKRYPGAFSKPSGHSVTFDLGSESKIKV